MTAIRKMLTPAAHRHVLGLPGRNSNLLHNGSTKRMLADCSRRKRQGKTAFIKKYGVIDNTKMPFGLCYAPSTFQRCMELTFRGMQWKHLLGYLDDIITSSQDMEFFNDSRVHV